MLRMRDNATVKELNIPKDVLEVIENSKTISDHTKVRVIKKLTGGLCCVCGGIPSHEVIHQGVKKWCLVTTTHIEHYCQDCFKKEYSIFYENENVKNQR